MMTYDVATKVLDAEQFPQHNIPGLISGITFIVLFLSGEAFTLEENTQTHTTHTHHTHTYTYTHIHTHTHTHANTHTHTHTQTPT